jgi:hypothetical protein
MGSSIQGFGSGMKGGEYEVSLEGDVTVVEPLVEVLLTEEQLCQRCAYYGSWEYSYTGEVRYQKVEGSDSNPLYWCRAAERPTMSD